MKSSHEEGIPNLSSLVEDCKLFNVNSTVMWTISYGITRIVRVRLLLRSEEIVKHIRKEMILVGIKQETRKAFMLKMSRILSLWNKGAK